MKKEVKENFKKVFAAFLALFVVAFFVMYFEGKDILEEGKGSGADVEYKNFEYKNISSETLNSMIQLKERNQFFLVNTNDENGKYIEKTDAFIPYTKILKRQLELPKEKNFRVVVYSKNGNMSKIAAKKLILLGYTNVFNLNGGVNDWTKTGFLTNDQN